MFSLSSLYGSKARGRFLGAIKTRWGLSEAAVERLERFGGLVVLGVRDLF